MLEMVICFVVCVLHWFDGVCVYVYMFYVVDNNPFSYILTSFRFGSFEIFKTRDHVTGRTGPSVGRIDVFHQLLDYTIKSYFPQVWQPRTTITNST